MLLKLRPEGRSKELAKAQSFESELKKLLSLRATEKEISELADKGIAVKNPTKLTLLAVALYEKALKGDLSAIREISSGTGERNDGVGGVIFIDDIRNSNK